MPRPRLLDLFGGAGGACKGYQRAGFYVVSVDIEPQPHSCADEFIQADVFEFLHPYQRRLDFDAVHASPPCQEFTVYRNARPGAKPRWPDLIEQTREALGWTRLPWVMENVPGAPVSSASGLFGQHGAEVCGTALGVPIRRHRLFESSFPLASSGCAHAKFTERRFPGSSNRPNGRTVCNVGEYRVPLAVQKECMEVDWPVTLHELSEMVPPCYGEFIGRQLLAHIERVNA